MSCGLNVTEEYQIGQQVTRTFIHKLDTNSKLFIVHKILQLANKRQEERVVFERM